MQVSNTLTVKKKNSIEQQKNLRNIRFFIFSSGKTGSSSLEKSFKHSFRAHGQKSFLIKYPKLSKILTLSDLLTYSHDHFHRKPLIITSIREPISRTISGFFTKITTHLNKTQHEIKTLSIQTLVDKFLSCFLTLEEYHTHVDLSLMGGINIMQEPFNKDVGYGYYENNKVRLLVLRFDKINEWPKIIPKYLHRDELKYFNFNSNNVSSNKWYGDIYKEFLNKLKIPREMIEEKYNKHKEVMEHFYNKEEIDKIKQKYEKTSIN